MGFRRLLEGGEKTKIHYKMSTKTPLPTVNEKATESVSIKGLFVGRVSSKLAQLLRHCIRLSVKVHGGVVWWWSMFSPQFVAD